MARDKLITIRIEEDKRDNFKRWAESRGKDVSGFLYEVIDACLSGTLDEQIVNEPLDNYRLDEVIEQRIATRIDDRLGNLDSLLDNRIEGKVESAVASLREELALLRLKVERLSQEDERLRPEVQPISPKPPETETDIDNSGLTTTQLARELGVAHSQISRWRSGERKPSDPAIAEKFSQWEFDEESKRWYRREDTTVN